MNLYSIFFFQFTNSHFGYYKYLVQFFYVVKFIKKGNVALINRANIYVAHERYK